MKYTGKSNEVFFASSIVPERSYMFNQDLRTGLSIIWNTGEDAHFMIDKQMMVIEKNAILFLTEFHHLDNFQFESMNVIQFNRDFYCVEQHDSDVGCKGVLFFGASDIPKVIIPPDQLRQFTLLWEFLLIEVDEHDELKLEMLRTLVKRFLILGVRLYKTQQISVPNDNKNIGLIREFNYLVEQNYKTYTKVSDYAKLLFKSPKTLSNIFKQYIDKSPLSIINERRFLEAKRLLLYTDSNVQEIADDLNFSDIHSFSRFFKTRAGESPTHFRLKAVA